MARNRQLKTKTLTRTEVERALAFTQPHLVITEAGNEIFAKGKYIVSNGPHSDGPIARYQICIIFSKTYPNKEPLVMEEAGAIDRIADRHMYSNGCCCTCVWEEWLATTEDTSVKAFCGGPLHNFFLSQVIYDQTGKWPFGERGHGVAGIVEAAGEILDLDIDQAAAQRYLRVISAREIKGHWACPCGSSRKLRGCCRKKLMELREQVDRDLARRLLKRLIRMIEQDRGKRALARQSE